MSLEGASRDEASPLTLFDGGGELGQRMRSLDWSKTPLGPVAGWPQSLKTCVRIVLTSRQPMFVWWGEELINLYNDAYKSIVGGKHPAALGQPASVVWREIWDQVGPRAEQAMRGNQGTYDEALLLIMERHGYQEETYYTFSYSPVPNERGGVGGILCANTDDTGRIIGERRLWVLREIAARTADARRAEDACARAADAMATAGRDLPFALIYLEESGRGWDRCRPSGRAVPHRAPGRLALARGEGDEQAPGATGRESANLGGGVADRRVDPASVTSDRLAADPVRTGGSVGRAHRRAQPVPPFRRRLPQLPLAGRRTDHGRRRQRAGLRGRAPPCGGAGRDRPRQDRILLQRESRVPHAAHPDVGAAGGRARLPERCARRREPAGRAPEHLASAAPRKQSPRLLAHRGRSHEGSVRADGSRSPHRRSGQCVPLGDRTRRAPFRGRLPHASGAGLRRPDAVGDHRPQPPFERLQVHPEGDNPGPAPRPGGPSRARGQRHGRRDPGGRATTHVRSVPPGGGPGGSYLRGLGHRTRTREGAGRAPRRGDQHRQRRGVREHVPSLAPPRAGSLAGRARCRGAGSAGRRRLVACRALRSGGAALGRRSRRWRWRQRRSIDQRIRLPTDSDRR